ncbi:MAG: septal ring lytic transglycosylase RlpA family protein [Thermoanaerobaculia bacterium]
MTLRARLLLLAMLVLVLEACVSTAPRSTYPARFTGTASWYGQEFAGRTTSNGEIFDPMLLTAAHRSLPFGTVLRVTNPANGESVLVRINDRGPFIEGRVLDLSYAAAKAIGLVEAGIGTVNAEVVRLGAGDREPPKPLLVELSPKAETTPASSSASKKVVDPTPPDVPFPLPEETKRATKAANAPKSTQPDTADAPVDVTVIEEHGGRPVVRKVGPDGKTFVGEPPEAASEPAPRPATAETNVPDVHYVLQVGAFQVAANAQELKEKIDRILPSAFIEESGSFFRVRLGPFDSRAKAIDVRERLESAGIAAIIIAAP